MTRRSLLPLSSGTKIVFVVIKWERNGIFVVIYE